LDLFSKRRIRREDVENVFYVILNEVKDLEQGRGYILRCTQNDPKLGPAIKPPTRRSGKKAGNKRENPTIPKITVS
jgi:hypothetical protein